MFSKFNIVLVCKSLITSNAEVPRILSGLVKAKTYTIGLYFMRQQPLHQLHMEKQIKQELHVGLCRLNPLQGLCPVALFTKILTIKQCRKCKTKIKKSFTKILTIILSVKIVLTLRVKLPCPKCKILIVREILVLSFIVSEKNRKKDGRCIGAST